MSFICNWLLGLLAKCLSNRMFGLKLGMYLEAIAKCMQNVLYNISKIYIVCALYFI